MDFCGNYMLQPQWMYPPDFWNTPGMDRNCNFLHNKHKSCYRCGNLFSHGHQAKCSARNAKCFKCGKLGHFGRLCFSRTRINRNEISSLQVQERKPKQSKSSAKRRRDSKRIKEYKARKQVLSILPFGDITNTEVTDLLQNSNSIQIKTMEKQNFKLKEKIKIKDTECEKLKTENSALHDEKKILQLKCKNETTELLAIIREKEKEIQNFKQSEEDILQVNKELYRDFTRMKHALDITAPELRDLRLKVQNLPSENIIGDLQMQIEKLQTQKKKLERVCTIFKSEHDKFSEAIEIVQDELNPRYPVNRRILAEVKKVLNKKDISGISEADDPDLILEYLNTYHV